MVHIGFLESVLLHQLLESLYGLLIEFMLEHIVDDVQALQIASVGADMEYIESRLGDNEGVCASHE